MRIIVCIKQVPDTTDVKIDPETNTLVRQGVPATVNPFDLHALEEALVLKERHGGQATAITMGPQAARSALETAIAMGIDDAVLLSDRAFAGSDTLATSYALAKAIEHIGQFDLILCGKQAIDGDTAQVGPGIAEHLGILHITCVRQIMELSAERIVVNRMVEGGSEIIACPLPALLTVLKDINEPRFPSLKGTMRARKAEIPVWTAADIGADPRAVGLDGSPTEVIRIFTPDFKSRGEMLAGEPAEQARQLIARLEAAGVLLGGAQ